MANTTRGRTILKVAVDRDELSCGLGRLAESGGEFYIVLFMEEATERVARTQVEASTHPAT